MQETDLETKKFKFIKYIDYIIKQNEKHLLKEVNTQIRILIRSEIENYKIIKKAFLSIFGEPKKKLI